MINLEKLSTFSIETIHEHLKKGDFTVTELVDAYLAVIEKENARINGYLEVFADVKEQAAAAEARFKAGTATTLTGIPIAVKDNILIKGRRSGAASKILEGYTASYDATAIKKLKEHGVVFLGRTNMDEFAMGGSNENSAYGPVRNPHDTERVSGGSSGGSAAVVAMNGACVALGSDTGGSVRQPASFCGVVGLKPTYGAISRSGLMAMGSSLDQIGPIGKTVEDVEILFDVMKGPDPLDSTSFGGQFGGQAELSTKIGAQPTPKTIGVPRHFMEKGIDPGVKDVFEKALTDLENKGFVIKEIELPHIQYSLAVYYVLMPAEASSNLARFDGVKYGALKESGIDSKSAEASSLLEDYIKTRTEGFGKEVRRRIIMGNYILSSGYYDAYYNKANQVRDLLRADFEKAFAKVDCIMTPTSPVPAFKIGEKSSDPLSMYLADIFTVTANLVGVPALSVPYGTVDSHDAQKNVPSLPVGIQFMAPHRREDMLFSVGKALMR